MSSIRIIATPDGEAPEEVRRAWIGLILPLPERVNFPVKTPTVGVLTGPKTRAGFWFRYFFRKNTLKIREHFVVVAKTAVEILAQDHPEAAQWWYEHKPEYRTSTTALLGFEVEVCEYIL